MKFVKCLFITACVSIVAQSGLYADTPALDLVGSGTPITNPNDFTVGWEFQVNSTIVLTELGFWDEGSDGLAQSHLVRLWNSSGSSLLSSATIDNSSLVVESASDDGQWLVESVANITLEPGMYVIGADGGFDLDAARGEQGILTIPQIQFTGQREIGGSGFPSNNSGFGPGFFGPTFFVSVVPEPSSAFVILSLVGYSVTRRRRI